MHQKTYRVQKVVSDNKKHIVYFDTKEYVVNEDTIIRFLIFKDKEFTENELKEIIDYNETNNLLSKVLHYLSFQSRSVMEITKYLNNKNATNLQIENILNKLSSYNYLDDERLTKEIVEYHIRNIKGPNKAIEKLKEKGISDEYFNIVSEKYSYEIEKELIEGYLQKNDKKYINNPIKQQKNKYIEKLLRDGFSSNIVLAIINNYPFSDGSNQTLLKDINRYLGKYSDLSEYEKKQKVIAALMRKGYEYKNIIDKL